MKLSESTVKQHFASLMELMSASNRTEVILKAAEARLFDESTIPDPAG